MKRFVEARPLNEVSKSARVFYMQKGVQPNNGQRPILDDQKLAEFFFFPRSTYRHQNFPDLPTDIKIDHRRLSCKIHFLACFLETQRNLLDGMTQQHPPTRFSSVSRLRAIRLRYGVRYGASGKKKNDREKIKVDALLVTQATHFRTLSLESWTGTVFLMLSKF